MMAGLVLERVTGFQELKSSKVRGNDSLICNKEREWIAVSLDRRFRARSIKEGRSKVWK